MLVSVDESNGTVTIYGNIVTTISFKHLDRIHELIAGKQVQYISEVTSVWGDEVLDMVTDLANSREFPDVSVAVAPNEKQWIHCCTMSGQMYLPLAANLKLEFTSPSIFFPLEKIGFDYEEKYPIIVELIKKKKLAIVGTKRMMQIQALHQKRVEERDQKMYGDLIIDTRVSQLDRKNMSSSLGRPGRGDAIDMDDYSKDNDATNSNFIDEDAKIALQQGWGKPETEETEAKE